MNTATDERQVHKIIGINTKGGAGKSTLIQQAMAPFIYLAAGRIRTDLLEIDDINEDARVFVDHDTHQPVTMVFNPRQIPASRDSMEEHLTAELILSPSNTVIDTGGNRTAEMVMNVIRTSSLGDAVTGWVIPLNALDEAAAANAVRTYRMIRDASSSPVVFALNQVIEMENRRITELREIEDQFPQFCGTNRTLDPAVARIEGYLRTKIGEADRNWIAIGYTDVIEASRRFQRTVWELAESVKLEDIRADIRRVRDVANDITASHEVRQAARHEALHLARISRTNAHMHDWARYTLAPAFETLARVLKVEMPTGVMDRSRVA